MSEMNFGKKGDSPRNKNRTLVGPELTEHMKSALNDISEGTMSEQVDKFVETNIND